MSVIPQGAIRLNTESQKLEFYAQDQWWEMATDFPYLNNATNSDIAGGARGVFVGGSTPTKVNTMDYVNIASAGDAVAFGNLSEARRGIGSCSDKTRGVMGGGDVATDKIDYITISTLGDAVDFGNLSVTRGYLAAVNNATRGLFGGAWSPSNSDVIDYVTIASTGDAKDFGDLTEAQQTDGSFSSPTRGFWVGGAAGSGPTYQASTTGTKIECVTTTTLGDAFDFGDLQNGTFGKVGASNSTRGLAAGGYRSPANILAIELITMATLGNSTNFGDTTNSHYYGGGASDPIRALFAGGSGPTDIIEYVNITTEGDAVDFGNLSQARNIVRGLSNANGGL
tara:strand:+ start:789 stop:1805 length:1017 start_codon:yes stop_codon:yes gene_type:complete